MDIYSDRISKYAQVAELHRKRALLLSTLRGVCFVLLAICAYEFFQTRDLPFLFATLLAVVLFIFLINRHQKHDYLRQLNATLADLNSEERERLVLNLSGFDEGNRFKITNHQNQEDLDILGKHSLFQLLNRCGLEDSMKLLTDWLSNAVPIKTIKERQECIKELMSDLDWLQDLEAKIRIAVQQKKKHEPAANSADLLNWATKLNQLKAPIVWRVAALVLTLITLVLTGLIIQGSLTYQFIYGVILVNGILLGVVLGRLSKQTKGIDIAKYIISSYKLSIEAIISKKYVDPNLSALVKQIQQPSNALKGISELSKITLRVSARSNVFYFLLDIIFLLDIHLLIKIESWKKHYGPHLEKWLDTIHEMEVLASISSFAHAQKHYTFPKLEEGFVLKGEEIGHPLIPANKRVCNDYTIEGKGSIDIITGSNMSGKSTFQRTLGINLILGRTGAPVCAKSFTMSNIIVFTSMRTKDNLEENTSSFYAELKRIKQLLEIVEHNPVFFLLDEILKGTNSDDRHLGAVELIKKLSYKSAFGLISTHDLTLGNLEKSKNNIRNFSFNSEIIDDKITFDYLLTPGPCKSFNASQLMRNLGIID
ncbi:MAG: hypothetical protein RJQ14_11410 [Marinoscillum sp.]